MLPKNNDTLHRLLLMTQFAAVTVEDRNGKAADKQKNYLQGSPKIGTIFARLNFIKY